LASGLLIIGYILDVILTVRDNVRASRAKRNAPALVVKLTGAERAAEWTAPEAERASHDEKWADFNDKIWATTSTIAQGFARVVCITSHASASARLEKTSKGSGGLSAL
jgi:hypothetical protein